LLILAILLLELDHTPPDEGKSCEVLPIQIIEGPLLVAIGLALTVIGAEASEAQPVVELVNTTVACPGANAETMPELLTEAIDGLLDIHVPPLDGLMVVEAPTHIDAGPEIDILGLPLTVISSVASDWQLADEVKINDVTPCAIPVTVPLEFIVAIPELLLIHEPPVEGKKLVVPPKHKAFGPEILTAGLGLTVMGSVFSDSQPVAASKNLKVAWPADNPTTTPEFEDVAIEGLLLCHVPPEDG
jgi:hypothetical protein